MTGKAKPVIAETISKMKNAMFNQLTESEPGLYDTCTFTIPVIDLMILEREAIQLEQDYARLREAIADTVDMIHSGENGDALDTLQQVLEEVNK